MLTANIGSNLKAKFGNIRAYTVGSETIWGGGTVVLRSDGLAYPGVEDDTDTYKQLVVGWALEKGIPGATIRVRSDGQLLRRFPGVTTAAIGKLALIKDDETVHTYAANVGKVVCGRITSILTEGLEVFVDFSDRPSRVASNLYE
jgi:hypothetical protein